MEKVTNAETEVVITTNRLWYGKDSTGSAFLATAYDGQGNAVDSMEGYFLEPVTDYERAKKAGSDTAIMFGEYNVVSGAELEKRINAGSKGAKTKLRFQWYVDNVPGRSGIAIHVGNYGKDTTGCLLSGENYSYDKAKETYMVLKSTKKTKELFEFFDKYGKKGIRLRIGL